MFLKLSNNDNLLNNKKDNNSINTIYLITVTITITITVTVTVTITITITIS